MRFDLKYHGIRRYREVGSRGYPRRESSMRGEVRTEVRKEL